MVKLNKIYTRTGDDGTTGLVSGARRLKCDLRVKAYGAIDETNALIGIARLHSADQPDFDAMLSRIQNDCFDLGADLATPEPEADAEPQWQPLRIIDHQVERLEAEIDRLNKDLEPLRSFILPAGTPLSAHLHLARTVARRAERDVVALQQAGGEHVNPAALRYLNRLSDFLFVAARWTNAKGAEDVLWVPGDNR
ncbi:cob(I)yrinic acid a,c-diamide adenosyltransferase [Pseudohoeflea coraliihabitans]|uniref:Corrinoid adenosyltransferase n=1 Tax=Pseudohoeflea coraliihabitans TaxID=2860393 RepID=A0ABS6WN53_9HYPH|nr:cob(I)yrinic acid a,c-diamide adenosyltransferase [Pseudohoeflea sp. DP4N28-3]MBW3096509.1 cob(I)yrinic acid a,c-diamide adenosyltransferase [Pseudohoeflea sp. DP4N28-3]